MHQTESSVLCCATSARVKVFDMVALLLSFEYHNREKETQNLAEIKQELQKKNAGK